MSWQKTFLTFLLVGLLTCPSEAFALNGQKSRAAICVDMQTGRIIYAHHPDLPIAPASITKIMTLYLTYEAVEAGKVHWSDEVVVSPRACRLGGTRMFLRPNLRVTLSDLALGTAIASANDAAWAIAEHIGGDVETFVGMMNRKARELGMKNTVFKNPHGLPEPGQVTTARDIMILSKAYVSRFPASLALHSQSHFTYRGRILRNRNHLLGHYPGADGIKTGFICESGYNISATAKRGNTRLIAVVLGARTYRIRDREVEQILDEGFRTVTSSHSRPSGKGG
ncbi:MAG TPA: D-alanyl-D-alanine carboxypeptidase family protein [Syntrophales bacterium]|nr:D-alanyl-D-alanine carboxypeptidase family protein [Syntrophales bacterium]HOL58667.1 D-alanyl-D-alanine carboxypeptidase family protein [Syntrophales bacterium]HPO35045.1 D-alanyl-D-alanine carboxypeptidase family protein [Syntrophales bacterium]